MTEDEGSGSTSNVKSCAELKSFSYSTRERLGERSLPPVGNVSNANMSSHWDSGDDGVCGEKVPWDVVGNRDVFLT